MTRIELDGLVKEFDSLTAIDGVSLTIEDGEFLVLVGPSGCGKSTLMRTIAGLETPTEGDVVLDGTAVTDWEPKDRNVAMVFQNYALYPHMTARRNMTFGMNSVGSFTDEEIDRRVEETADILDIADLLDRKPAELSGGEKQRVAMGRALLRDPDVFLLDEPLSNLDAKLRDQMRAELQQLHKEIGTTTVYVTHDQTEAMTLGQRVAVMNDGEIQQVDSPQTLYDFPNTQFAAEFVGSPAMNVVPVLVEHAGDRWFATHEQFRVPLPSGEGLAERQFAMGVRPEDLHVVGESQHESAHIDGTVKVTEPQGDALLVHCRVGNDTLRVLTDSRASYEIGDSIGVNVDDRRVHLFDPDDGRTVYHSEGQQARTEAILE
ncbi:ABC transporter ATP-binding protein [Halorussus amylolyticus]|uniref:ABC transporter ATP-binding protein n=1 Tax=Halorussus amylolyticus TaxID=1126242 RepID=UPI00104CC8D8|nr:ABC transporter ATP-binding protein [Halorussus amylolyticus]